MNNLSWNYFKLIEKVCIYYNLFNITVVFKNSIIFLVHEKNEYLKKWLSKSWYAHTMGYYTTINWYIAQIIMVSGTA